MSFLSLFSISNVNFGVFSLCYHQFQKRTIKHIFICFVPLFLFLFCFLFVLTTVFSFYQSHVNRLDNLHCILIK